MCTRVALPGGGFAIVCGGHRGHSLGRCAYPDCKTPATIECDHPTAEGRTCDRKTCRAHAKPVGRDVDWCWLCAREEAKNGNAPRLAL